MTCTRAMPGPGADVATWNFERLLPGTYRVAATWTKYTNRATNAPFTIQDGETVLGHRRRESATRTERVLGCRRSTGSISAGRT